MLVGTRPRLFAFIYSLGRFQAIEVGPKQFAALPFIRLLILDVCDEILFWCNSNHNPNTSFINLIPGDEGFHILAISKHSTFYRTSPDPYLSWRDLNLSLNVLDRLDIRRSRSHEL